MSNKLVLPFFLVGGLLAGMVSAADDVLVADHIKVSDAPVPLNADELWKTIVQEEGEMPNLVSDNKEEPAQLVLQSFEGVYDLSEVPAEISAHKTEPSVDKTDGKELKIDLPEASPNASVQTPEHPVEKLEEEMLIKVDVPAIQDDGVTADDFFEPAETELKVIAIPDKSLESERIATEVPVAEESLEWDIDDDLAESFKVQDQAMIKEVESLSSATPSVHSVKRTPLENRLLRAVRENRGRLVRDILRNPRVNVNITDDTGKTPLMLAVLFNRPGIAKEILKHNPDLTVVNYDQQTALDMARAQCSKKLVKLLQSAAIKSPACL